MTPKKRKITKHGLERWEVDYGFDEFISKNRRLVNREVEADELISEYEKGVKKQGDWWMRLPPWSADQSSR